MLVVVNTASGTMSRPAERDRLRALLPDAEFVETTDVDTIEAVVDTRQTEVVVAAGGDGTVSAVAARLAGTDRTLGVIPGGTLNHFARDLGVPADLEGAVAVLRAGRTRRVDVAEVNGRMFVNNSSLGLYVEVVREREKFRKRGLRKWTAFAGAIVEAMLRWPVLRVWIEAEGRAVTRRTPFVFIGNNRYRMEGLRMGSRDRLDEGELWLLTARRLSRWAVIHMAVSGLTGGLHDSRDLDVLRAGEILVRMRRRRVAVALDGELTPMLSPLRYRIRPGALKVIAP